MLGKAGLDMHRRLHKGGGYERECQQDTRNMKSEGLGLEIPETALLLAGAEAIGQGKAVGQRGCVETPVTQTASPGLSVGPGSNQDPSLCPLGCLIKVSERSAHPSPKPWHFSQESAGVGLKPKHASQPSRCACNTFICYWKQGVAGGVWVTLGKSQAL